MKIHNLSTNVDNSYFEQSYLDIIESHMSYLMSMDTVRSLSVSNFQSVKYKGDLFGLFDDLKISKKYHLIVAKFNGYQDPYSYMGDRMLINLPDLNEIDMLNGVYRTKNTF